MYYRGNSLAYSQGINFKRKKGEFLCVKSVILLAKSTGKPNMFLLKGGYLVNDRD